MNKIEIIGNGKMAVALYDGLQNSYDVSLVARDTNKTSDKKTNLLTDSYDIENKTVILAVKPYALKDISLKLKGKAKHIISIMAGVKLDTIKALILSDSYTRAMPNIAASYKKSATSLYGDTKTKNLTLNIFNKIGKAIWLDKESDIDAATAIAGSGAAFLAMVAEALSDGGVEEGLKRELSQTLVESLFEGFVPLLNNHNTLEIKQNITSPSGTTSAGLVELEKNRVRSAFIEAIKSANKRAKTIANG